MLDTSILVRLANTADADFLIADQVITVLDDRREELLVTPQVLIEFWCVATRPTAANGLGLNALAATKKTEIFEAAFRVLPDVAGIYPAWRRLVTTLGVLGKQAHDARLIAVCHTYGIPQILTFNVRHFNRLASLSPDVSVIDPTALS